MAGPDSPTFRVRRIPAHIDGFNVSSFLLSVLKDIGTSENVQILSLAPTPGDWTSLPSQTATLQFGTVPEFLRDDKGLSGWTIDVPGQKLPLLIDTHFLDFTVLNRVEPDKHTHDVIAIHGLGGHAFGAWRKHNPGPTAKSFMWLRDQLPLDFPEYRIMTYGYDTRLLKSNSFQTIDDLALTLVAKLKAIGKVQSFTTPIIFLAHSLGGIILKRAMLFLAESTEVESFMLSRIRMIIFFGTPNMGLDTSFMEPMVDGQPNQQLLRVLSDNSSEGYLTVLDKSFSGIAYFQKIRLISAFETQLTKTAIETRPGEWERSGPAVVLVNRVSAIQSGSNIPRDIFSIDRNHSDIVKLIEDDPSYSIVTSFLREAASSTITSKWLPFFISGPSTLLTSMSSFVTRALGWNQDVLPDLNALNARFAEQSVQRVELPRQNSIRQAEEPNIATGALEQLQFEYQDLRYEQITDAFSNTFEWLLDDTIGLMSWLKHGSGIFWIRGKPGSGKSTLMKYLRKTHDELEKGNVLHISSHQSNIWHFFHERGSHLQKSFEGLLRTIIFTIVRDHPELAHVTRDFTVTKDGEETEIWTMVQLQEAFEKLKIQQIIPLEVTLFVDALDEFYGFPEVIADFVASITLNHTKGMTRFRICFASRPYDAFVEKFDTCLGFKLQDYTKGDISHYAKSRLSTVPTLHSAFSGDLEATNEDLTGAGDVIESITTKAEGVFLWVRLVIDHLVSMNDPSISILEEILLQLPGELEEFYDWTVDRLSRSDRLSAFILIEMVLRSTEPLLLQDLYYAFHCAQGKTHAECVKLLHHAHKSGISEERMMLQLSNLCGGLIEVVKTTTLAEEFRLLYDDSHLVVQFIHRTVKEYAGRPALPRRLLGAQQVLSSENGNAFLLKYWFARLYSDKATGERTMFMLDAAQSLEASTGCHFGEFLDSIPTGTFRNLEDDVVQCTRGLINRPFKHDFDLPITSAVSFAVSAGLILYLNMRYSQGDLRDHLDPVSKIPLLHYAANAFVLARIVRYDFENQADVSWAAPYVGVFILIIENGSPSDIDFNFLTPFERYWSLLRSSTDSLGWIISSFDDVPNAEITETLLKAGQNPNIDITYFGRNVKTGPLHDENKILSATCKALHVADLSTCKVLLAYGANVNCLDSNGRTPADCCIAVMNSEKDTLLLQGIPTAIKKLNLLVAQGGCLTENGYHLLQEMKKKRLSPKFRGLKLSLRQDALSEQERARFEDKNALVEALGRIPVMHLQSEKQRKAGSLLERARLGLKKSMTNSAADSNNLQRRRGNKLEDWALETSLTNPRTTGSSFNPRATSTETEMTVYRISKEAGPKTRSQSSNQEENSTSSKIRSFFGRSSSKK